MSAKTKREVPAKLRRAYARAGSLYKRQLLDQAVALLGYHRKAAIRALRARARRCLAADRLKPPLAALKAKTRPRGPQPPSPKKWIVRASNRSPSCTGACASTARRPWPW
jgi:hypothetical protein